MLFDVDEKMHQEQLTMMDEQKQNDERRSLMREPRRWWWLISAGSREGVAAGGGMTQAVTCRVDGEIMKMQTHAFSGRR